MALENVDDTTLGMYENIIMFIHVQVLTLMPPPPSICTDIEVLHDMNAAVVTVVDWRDLGLALGLSPHTLERIAAQYPRDPSRCLTEVLAEWLQKRGRAAPSWRALARALRSSTVQGGEIASRIVHACGM